MNGLATRPLPRIVATVAEAEDVGPLAEVVGSDELETLIEGAMASELEIRFTYRSHDVVDESGRVQIS